MTADGWPSAKRTRKKKTNATAKWRSNTGPGGMEPTPDRSQDTPRESLKRLVETMKWRVPTNEEAQEYLALVGLLGVENVTKVYDEVGYPKRFRR